MNSQLPLKELYKMNLVKKDNLTAKMLAKVAK